MSPALLERDTVLSSKVLLPFMRQFVRQLHIKNRLRCQHHTVVGLARLENTLAQMLT